MAKTNSPRQSASQHNSETDDGSEVETWSQVLAEVSMPARSEAGIGDSPTVVYAEYQDGPWLRGLFRPLLIALVASSLAAGPLAVLRLAAPGRLSYLLPLLFLAAIEGVYTTRQLGRPQWRDRRGLAFRLGEIALLLVILRLAEWAFGTGLPDPATLAVWLREPVSFFDNEFVLSACLLLLAWGFAVAMTGDFLELALRPDEIAAQEHHRYRESASFMRAGLPTGRSDILHGFVERWVWGGILVVALAAAGRVSVSGAGNWLHVGLTQTGLDRDVLLALLCYFLGGFLLISQARLAVLRAGWFNEGIPVAPAVLNRWHTLGVLTLFAVAGLAALLPLGPTAGLAFVLGLLLGLLIQFMYLLMALLLFLWGLLLYPFRSLFSQAPAPPPQLDLSQLPAPAPPTASVPPWLGGAVFWLVVTLVIGYLLVAYLAAHRRAGGGWAGPWNGPWQRLLYWWRARWARARRRAGAARAALRLRFGRVRPASPVAGRPRLLEPAAGVPRARVRYFYLSAVQRAGERGVARPPEQTPREFAETLRQEWPDAEMDLAQLTEAFIEARYADRPIAADEARGVESIWSRVMRALGRRGAVAPAEAQPPAEVGPADDGGQRPTTSGYGS